MQAVAFLPVALLAVVDWFAVARRQKNLEYFFNPAVMTALIGVAFQIGDEAPTRQLYATVAALFFSLIGDVFLMLPRDLFLQGLSSFFVAHVCYVIALVRWPWDTKTWIVAVLLVAIALPVIRLMARGMAERDQRQMLWPVIAYSGAITAMVMAAVSFAARPSPPVEATPGTFAFVLEPVVPEVARIAALIGATLFYSSDLMIGIDRFVRRFRAAPVAIIVTYHLGQIGLVAALAR